MIFGMLSSSFPDCLAASFVLSEQATPPVHLHRPGKMLGIAGQRVLIRLVFRLPKSYPRSSRLCRQDPFE